MWKRGNHEKKRIVKSTMAAETLIQVESTDACFWPENLVSVFFLQ